MRFARSVLAIAVAVGLSACGGGGGDEAVSQPSSEPSVPDTGSSAQPDGYPLAQAMRNRHMNAITFEFSASTTNGCVGTGSFTASAPQSGAVFEGVAALSSDQVLSISYSNCTPATIRQSWTTYLDADANMLGSSGYFYSTVSGTVQYPSVVRAGDSGVLYDEIAYSDSSKATKVATARWTYRVEPETDTSVIFEKRSSIVEGSGVAREIFRYRITRDAQAVLLSWKTLYSNGIEVEFVPR